MTRESTPGKPFYSVRTAASGMDINIAAMLLTRNGGEIPPASAF